MKPLANFAVYRVNLHRHICICHDRVVLDRRIACIRHLMLFSNIDRLPLPCARARFFQLPFITKQKIKITIVPLGWVCGPGALKARCVGCVGFSVEIRVVPAKPSLAHTRLFGRWSNIRFHTMALADSVAADRQCGSLFVVHRHAQESHAHILCGRRWIRVTVHSLRVHVD